MVLLSEYTSMRFYILAFLIIYVCFSSEKPITVIFDQLNAYLSMKASISWCLIYVSHVRCQWQVEANGAISPALTPSPSPLPLTIDEEREFTYPSDILVPPPGACCELPRIHLPQGIMGRLRELSGRGRPQFRPSIK